MELVKEIGWNLYLKDLADFIFLVSVLEWKGIGDSIMVEKHYRLLWVDDFY